MEYPQRIGAGNMKCGKLIMGQIMKPEVRDNSRGGQPYNAPLMISGQWSVPHTTLLYC